MSALIHYLDNRYQDRIKELGQEVQAFIDEHQEELDSTDDEVLMDVFSKMFQFYKNFAKNTDLHVTQWRRDPAQQINITQRHVDMVTWNYVVSKINIPIFTAVVKSVMTQKS